MEGGYICTKAINLGGTEYVPGDVIPAEAVLPSRVRALTNQKYIAPTGGYAPETAHQERQEQQGPVTIPIPIGSGDDSSVLEVDGATVAQAAIILQLTAEGAVEAIAGVANEDALLLVHAMDSRKTVKAAAEKQAVALKEQQESQSGSTDTTDAQNNGGETEGQQGGE